MRAIIPIATLAVLLIAGCIQPPTDLKAAAVAGIAGEVSKERLPAPDKDLSKAIVSNHGAPYMHAIPALHTGSYGIDLAGYNPLTQPMAGDNPAVANSGYAAVTLWNDTYACVSHFAGSGGAGGATIVDIKDPAKPTVIASIVDLEIGSRCQFTDDGKFLLVASYGGVHQGAVGPLAALGGVADAGANGMSIYDVSNPKAPKFLTHDVTGIGQIAPVNGNYHNFATANINGTNYVFQTYSGIVLEMAPDGKKLTQIAKLEHSDHDIWVGKHPITGTWELVTGAGYGTAFFDITDPAHPVMQGVWEGDKKGGNAGWHRQWPVEETVDGKAIMVVAGEECGNGKSLPYTTLDWTDPANVAVLGHWQIPGKPAITEPGQLCSMNSHEFEVFDGYVVSGNYHAGVWIFDVGSTERAKEPVTIGYYEPHEVPVQKGGTRNTPFAWSPDVWGAYADSRGYVYAADWYSGFYVLKFGATKV